MPWEFAPKKGKTSKRDQVRIWNWDFRMSKKILQEFTIAFIIRLYFVIGKYLQLCRKWFCWANWSQQILPPNALHINQLQVQYLLITSYVTHTKFDLLMHYNESVFAQLVCPLRHDPSRCFIFVTWNDVSIHALEVKSSLLHPQMHGQLVLLLFSTNIN